LPNTYSNPLIILLRPRTAAMADGLPLVQELGTGDVGRLAGVVEGDSVPTVVANRRPGAARVGVRRAADDWGGRPKHLVLLVAEFPDPPIRLELRTFAWRRS
jgi:hypothetical protein